MLLAAFGFALFMVLYIIIHWQPAMPTCSGSFQGKGYPFSLYVFQCLQNECTYTLDGAPGERPVKVYPVAKGLTIQAPAQDSSSWPYFNLVLNCTDKPVTIRQVYASATLPTCFTLGPKEISFEGISDPDARTFISVDKC